jgi:NAD(P)-dependent dehydrogenase (short-subunit alcohol dehydrogenase family)
LFNRELARRLSGTGVTTNALHPGAVATAIWDKSNPPWYVRLPISAARALLMRTPAKAADRILYLAGSLDVEGRNGGYYVDDRVREPSPAGRDDSLAARLWDVSAEFTSIGDLTK